MNADLSMWTIYERPLDFPNGFIARRWEIGEGEARATSDVLTGDTLEHVRGELVGRFPGLTVLPRLEEDEPQIVETWL